MKNELSVPNLSGFFTVSFNLLNIIKSCRPCLPSPLGNIAIWTHKPSLGNCKTSHYVSYSLRNFKGTPGVLLATFSWYLNLICCKILESFIGIVFNWVEGRSRDLSLYISWKLLNLLKRRTENCGWTWAWSFKCGASQLSLVTISRAGV